MYITKVEQKIDTADTKGKVSVVLEVDANNSNFVDSEAIEDPILSSMIDTFLKVSAAFVTNILHFYHKSPLLATYVLGGVTKIVSSQNDYYRDVSRNLPEPEEEAKK